MSVSQTNRTILLKRINSDQRSLPDHVADVPAVSDALMREIVKDLCVKDFDSFLDRFHPHVKVGIQYSTLDARVFTDEELYDPAWSFEALGIKSKSQLENMLFLPGKERMVRPWREIVDSFLKSEAAENMFWDFAELFSRELPAEDRRKAVAGFCQKWDSGVTLTAGIRKVIRERKDMSDVAWRLNEEELLKDSQMKTLDVLHRNSSLVTQKALEEFEEIWRDTYSGRNLQGWEWWIQIQKGRDEGIRQASELIHERMVTALQGRLSEFLGMLLNVYSYFQIYGDADGEMPPELLVMNCDPAELDAKGIRALDVFLNDCNEKNEFQNMLWYAIIPIRFPSDRRVMTRTRFQGNDTAEDAENNELSPEEYRNIINVFAKYRIQVFTSEERIVRYGQRPEDIMAKNLEDSQLFSLFVEKEHIRYLWPCAPNMIVLPERETKYPLTETGKNIYFHDLFIEASYVAAGLISACQDPGFLKKVFEEDLVAEEPGIRTSNSVVLDSVTKELSDHLPKLMPVTGMEGLDGWEDRIRGIMLTGTVSGIKAIIGQPLVEYFDERFAFDEVQVMTYVERVIRRESQDFERQAIKEFFRPGREHAYQRWTFEQGKVNAILQDRESLEYEIKEDTFHLSFVFQNDKKEIAVRIKR